jgi:hypothetical protein
MLSTTSLFLLGALATVVAGQQDAIVNITVPDGNLTLPYEFQSFGLSFDIKPGSDGRAIYDITWELMDGTQEEASNTVVDIVSKLSTMDCLNK